MSYSKFNRNTPWVVVADSIIATVYYSKSKHWEDALSRGAHAENDYFCTMNKRIFLLTVLIVVLATSDVFAQGCSQCRLLSEQASSAEEASFGSNINFGILYLMAVPYILLLVLFRKRIAGLFKALVKRP